MARSGSDHEEKYFHDLQSKQRRSLAEKLGQSATQLQEQRRIAEAVGTDDSSLAARIRALGFDHETVSVLDLLPLVHVAWADGRIQRAERATILHILQLRGMNAGDPPFLLMESLLEERPSAAYMEESLAVLRELLSSGKTAETDHLDETSLVELCRLVADASGGVLGFGRRVSSAEEAEIAKIAEALGEQARDAFQRSLG